MNFNLLIKHFLKETTVHNELRDESDVFITYEHVQNIHRFIAKNKYGEVMGIAEFNDMSDDLLFPKGIHVEDKFRRKGVATTLYHYAEYLLNKKIYKEAGQSKEGKLFRKSYDSIINKYDRKKTIRFN